MGEDPRSVETAGPVEGRFLPIGGSVKAWESTEPKGPQEPGICNWLRRNLDFIDHRRDVLHLVGEIDFGQFRRSRKRRPVLQKSRRGENAVRPMFSFAQGLQFFCAGSDCRCAFQIGPRPIRRPPAPAVPNRRTRLRRTRRFHTCPMLPPRPDREDLADISRHRVKLARPARSCRTGYLRRIDVQEPRVGMVGVQPVQRCP